MRNTSTYRGARRNEVRGTGQVPLGFGPLPASRRVSFLSKHPSKYTAHDGGGKYNPMKLDYKLPKIKTDPITGLPFTPILLTPQERLNNRKKKNTKHAQWKKRRSAGIHNA